MRTVGSSRWVRCSLRDRTRRGGGDAHGRRADRTCGALENLHDHHHLSRRWESAWCALRTNGTGSGYATTKRHAQSHLRTSRGKFLAAVSDRRDRSVVAGGAARIASTCSPYLVSFAWPRPGILIKACSVGRAATRRSRPDVASVKTQKAGTFSLGGLLLAPLLEQRQGALVVRRRAVAVPADLAFGRVVQRVTAAATVRRQHRALLARPLPRGSGDPPRSAGGQHADRGTGTASGWPATTAAARPGDVQLLAGTGETDVQQAALLGHLLGRGREHERQRSLLDAEQRRPRPTPGPWPSAGSRP